jgi:hypothetical protein
MTKLDIPAFTQLCKGASMESSLIMKLVDTLPALLPAGSVVAILQACSGVDRFDIVAKFLSRREKERIRKAVGENSELDLLLDLFNLR